mgnify:FL=1
MQFRSIWFPLVTAILIGVASCTLQEQSAASPDSQFRKALSVCRFQHTGAMNQRIALKATEEHVAKCLARRGWTPTGEPLSASEPDQEPSN